MSDPYLWVKALHIVAVISWMAGMLYLPRLFVYHCSAEPDSDKAQTFEIMERRLLRAIMNPAMIVVWITGPALVYMGGLWDEPWFWLKFVLVLIMTVAHHAFGRWRKAFEEGRNVKSEKFFRIANEVPTLTMIFIVILVVVRPF
ncbi:MAG: protoporphyrinogen oxidase HemJ [Alphaproteobacteria bacterium]|nr:protoporphyrinogen oxidase HemJ [Alphaproteobacteria bacterium]